MNDDALAKADTLALSDSLIPPPSTLARNDRIGPYQILRLVGRGGVGTVYHARVVESCALPVGREVAIKMLRQEQLSDADHRRFTREAAYLQALRHIGITRIYDIGEYRGRPYLVMELIEGKSLDELLDREQHRPLSPAHACDIMIQMCEALHVAHISGITHRDLKPGNVMLSPQGQVKLLDFGMAQRMSGESRLTASGSILGTPAYMSPEQARGHREWIGAHSDIYALGAVLYELVTGYQPFRAENTVAVLRAIIEEPLQSPRSLVPELPLGIETVILRAMAKDPRDRYASAEAMAEDLRRVSRGRRPKAGRIPFWQPWFRSIYYHRRLLSGIGLALFLIVSLTTLSILRILVPVSSPPEDPIKEVLVVPDAGWQEVWRHPEPLGESITAAAEWIPGLVAQEVSYTPVDPLNRDRRIRVESDLRITFTLRHLRVGESHTRVIFSHRAHDQGYILKIGERISLQRSRPEDPDHPVVTVASHPWTWGLQPLRLRVTRRGQRIRVYHLFEAAQEVFDATEDGATEQLMEEQQELLFQYNDLVPFEGSDHSGIAFVVQPDGVSLSDIVIERQPPQEMIHRIEIGDAWRQDGQYRRAEAFYRDFIRDFPDSERIRDAEYRRALSLVELGQHRQALDIFRKLADEHQDDPLYYVAAVFQAWQSALRLGRFSEAEQYFRAIRSHYNVESLLGYASYNMLRGLPRRYIETAELEHHIDPWRAVRLYDAASEIALFLGQPDIASQALLASGHLLVSIQEWEEADTRYQAINQMEGEVLPAHLLPDLYRAHLLRFQGREVKAEALYRQIISDRSLTTEMQGWARLWLSDLKVAQGQRRQAEELWEELQEASHIPGQIARNLLGPQDEIGLQGPLEKLNDIAYFNAIAAALYGDLDRFEDWFDTALSVSEPFEWPHPLLNQSHQRVASALLWHRYAEGDELQDERDVIPSFFDLSRPQTGPAAPPTFESPDEVELDRAGEDDNDNHIQ